MIRTSDAPSTLYAAQEAARAAHKFSVRISESSRIFDTKKEDAMPHFFRHEISRGALLGEGGFSSVYEIAAFDLSVVEGERVASEEDDKSEYMHRSRRFLEEHCVREKTTGGQTSDARYAIKFLKKEVMKDHDKFMIGAQDLVVEAKFLSSIQHPNIIKMRGVAAEGAAGFASGLEGGYFLIVDRLYETLGERIAKWTKQEKKLGLGIILRRSKRRSDRLADRLKVAYDIAGALKYLHGRNIIYRDLKPENIGFDVRGDVKIFDFGLAKEIDMSQSFEDDTYLMSGDTGTTRYMAPEVAKSMPYNLSADVYSFGIVLWEIAALSVAYEGMERRAHAKFVVNGDLRPHIEERWPSPLRSLISRSWRRDLHQRPTINCAYSTLRNLLVDLKGGDMGDEGLDLDHKFRRSTHVLLPTAALKKVAAAEGGRAA